MIVITCLENKEVLELFRDQYFSNHLKDYGSVICIGFGNEA